MQVRACRMRGTPKVGRVCYDALCTAHTVACVVDGANSDFVMLNAACNHSNECQRNGSKYLLRRRWFRLLDTAEFWWWGKCEEVWGAFISTSQFAASQTSQPFVNEFEFMNRHHKSFIEFYFMTIFMYQMTKNYDGVILNSQIQYSDQSKAQSTTRIPRIPTLQHSEIRHEGRHFACAVPMSHTSGRFKGQMYCWLPVCYTRTREVGLKMFYTTIFTLENDTWYSF